MTRIMAARDREVTRTEELMWQGEFSQEAGRHEGSGNGPAKRRVQRAWQEQIGITYQVTAVRLASDFSL